QCRRIGYRATRGQPSVIEDDMSSGRTPHPFFDVRMRGFRDRVEVAELVRRIDERVCTLAAETVPLTAAAGRVLDGAVVAAVAVPAFDRAAMDGYAVRGEETFGAGPYSPVELRVV